MFKYIQRLTVFAVTFLVLSGSSVLADPPTPTLLCLSVQDDGILVNWEVDGEGFDGVRIFFTLSGNQTFASVDFLATDTQGIIPVLDAQLNQYDVYMTTFSGTSAQSIQSQTLSTIEPAVVAEVTDNRIAMVSWNSLNNSFTGNYIVYRSVDNSTFKEVGQTSSTMIIDVIDGVCEFAPLYYYVDFVSNTCTSKSMTVKSAIEFKDQTPPEGPIFEYVTINDDGLSVLYWSHSIASDLDGYKIELKEGNTYPDHATIGIVNSFTDDPVINPDNYQNPCEQVVSYVLKAVDQCGTTSDNAYESIHNTIWLRVDLGTNCNRKATLQWNRYNNMNPPVSTYQIWRSRNDSVARIVGTKNDDGNSPGEFTFTDPEILISGEQYTYYISTKSEGSDKSSSSCRVVVAPDPELLNTFDLDNVSVYNNEYIDLFGNGEPANFISEVAIYRSSKSVLDLKPLMNISWDFQNMVISETSANVNDSAYYYQIVALDACGFPMDSSTIFRSIHLQLEDQGEVNVRLNWNAFEGWEDNLLGYDVFRMTDDVIDAGYPQPTTPTTLVFNDFIDPVSANGKITYYVEASSRNDELKSRSNEVLLPGEAEIILPNVFKPDSEVLVNGNFVNRIFLPLVKNVEPSSYLFVVYNRWGQLVFETNNPSEGWDGSRNGNISPAGIYAYLVNYSDYKGSTFQQKGKVTLLR